MRTPSARSIRFGRVDEVRFRASCGIVLHCPRGPLAILVEQLCAQAHILENRSLADRGHVHLRLGLRLSGQDRVSSTQLAAVSHEIYCTNSLDIF